MPISRRKLELLVAASTVGPLLLLAACAREPLGQDFSSSTPLPPPGSCQLDYAYFSGTSVLRDGIPALSQPTFLPANDPDIPTFLQPEDRVVGYIVDGKAYAVPHRILWYHEIANVSVPGENGTVELAVTYCPLTGSALVFDRAAAGGAEFGVSGLLYRNNLVMYDRRSPESLWPQMAAQARCGPATETRLPLYPAVEMSWRGWLTLYPTTEVLGEIGLTGDYEQYPYGPYEETPGFWYPMPPLDERRPSKERVLGLRIPGGEALAFPFGSLAERAATLVQPLSLGPDQTPAVLFWDATYQAAMAYGATLGDRVLQFEVTDLGIQDTATGSGWSVAGEAVWGPLSGARLQPAGEAFIAFWGAWYALHPDTELWVP